MPRAEHRFCLIAPKTNAGAPLADRGSLNNWFRANIDPGGGDWLDIELSATGNRPVTHYGCSGLLTEQDARRLFRRLLNLAAIDPPGDFDDRNRRQKRQYLLGQAAAIKAAIGVAVALGDRHGDDVGFNALLQAEGLQRI